MPIIEVTAVIRRPPEVVAEAFLDPVNATHWMADLERFEVVSREVGEAGSRARLHYMQDGQAYVMEDVLEQMIPDQYFQSRVSGNGLIAMVETWLRPVEEGTEVRMRWSGAGTNDEVSAMLESMAEAMTEQMSADLARFKALVEERGAHFAG